VNTYFSYNAAGEMTFQLVFGGQFTTGEGSAVHDGQITEGEINDKRDEVWARTEDNVAQKTSFIHDNLGRVHKTMTSVGVTTIYTHDSPMTRASIIWFPRGSTTTSPESGRRTPPADPRPRSPISPTGTLSAG